MVNRYISNDFIVSAEYLKKFKDSYIVPDNQTDSEIRDILNNAIKEFIAFVHSKTLKDTGEAIKVLNGTGTGIIFPPHKFKSYVLNQVNNFLRNWISEFSDERSYMQELADEETAFLFNCSSENRNFLASELEKHSEPESELIRLNQMLYRLTNDDNLVNKLDLGMGNPYIKYLSSSIRFLEVKIQNSKSQKSAAKFIDKGNCESKYCIDSGQIIELFKVLNNVVIQNIELPDFIRCFDLNNKPTITPQYIQGKQGLITYTLSLIDTIDSKIAFSNFNISNYYQMKNRPVNKSNRALQNKISSIINTPINVTLK